jgi:mannan endo-1,4-beta-mannosidase
MIVAMLVVWAAAAGCDDGASGAASVEVGGTLDGGAGRATDGAAPLPGAADAADAADARTTLDAGSPPTQTSRAKVLAYLAAISGKRTLSGQHNKYNATPSVSSDAIHTTTGKAPAFYSADFGFGQDAVANRGKMIAEVKAEWSSGAVVQLMFHTCVPTRDELCSWDDIGGAAPQHLTDAEWKDLVTDGTALNGAWKARLDALSVFFADLKAAGVAPLFRPLHEMNQPVFWWAGRGGAAGTRKLFQLTHDYLVYTKGFDNIVWVWDLQDFGTLASDVSAYDPGALYYDIAALDVYDGGYDAWKYDAIRGVAGGKPIAIGECQTAPTSIELAQQPAWTFFMLWPDFLDQNAAALPALYHASNVVTLDGMPGWK